MTNFPDGEFVCVDNRLFPHQLWLDAINTAGLQLVVERVKGTKRQVGRSLQAMMTPEIAKLARQRAHSLLLEHHGGISPEDAPPGWRVVGVGDV